MTRKPTPTKEPVAEAKKRASVPVRPVIQSTKLFRANLQIERQTANDALAAVDHALETEAGIRDAAVEAADKTYELALEAARNAREGATALAVERFNVVRSELDAERSDIIRVLDGVEAALAATQSDTPPGNVTQLREAAE